MVGTNREEKEVFIRMTKESKASKWNNETMSRYPDSAIDYGVKLKKGRKMHLTKSGKVKRRKVKVANIQGTCCCAANCNCKCLKCMCQSQRIAVAGNAGAIRARKQVKKRRERPQSVRKIKEQSKEELCSSSLVAQLTELVNRNRQRAKQKKRQEKQPTSTGEANEAKPTEIQSAGTASVGEVSNNSKSQPKDPEPSRGSPANDEVRVTKARKHFRKKKRQESSYLSRVIYDLAKTKGDRYQTKKRRFQRHDTSHSSSPSGSASSALAKIRRIRRKARDKNSSLKPPKKQFQ